MDSQRKEALDMQAEDLRRTERRLARGLEDVSHLFLSQTSGAPAEKTDEQKPLSGKAPSEPAQIRTPIILRASTAVSRELLVSLISRNTAALEEGMRAIDTNVPFDSFGSADLIAVDSADQLAIIDVDTVQNDDLLLRGISQFDWIVRNTQIVRRMYQGRVINFPAPPRLFLVAPGFSPVLKCAAQRITSPKVCCFVYHAAAINSDMGVLFEPA